MTVQAPNSMSWPKMSLAIPALNEVRNLPCVFGRIPSNVYEATLVDGYSDADGSADPGRIPRFVSALLNGADFEEGTRFPNTGGSTNITRLCRFRSRVFTSFFNVFYGARYSDPSCGYNFFWRQHVA